jgi:hypothetical protein
MFSIPQRSVMTFSFSSRALFLICIFKFKVYLLSLNEKHLMMIFFLQTRLVTFKTIDLKQITSPLF